MAAIERISVSAEHDTKPTLETTVAIQLHDLLRSYGFASEERCEAAMVPVRRAGPYFYGIGEDGRRHVLRLISPQSWELPPEESQEPDTPRRAFKVIRLEHGWLEADLDEGIIEEEDFHWSPYVVAVIDRTDATKPDFFNSENGKQLDFEDLMDLQAIASAMGQAFREEMYDTAMEIITEDDVAFEYAAPDDDDDAAEDARPQYGDFSFATIDSCASCDAANTFCVHRKGLLN